MNEQEANEILCALFKDDEKYCTWLNDGYAKYALNRLKRAMAIDALGRCRPDSMNEAAAAACFLGISVKTFKNWLA